MTFVSVPFTPTGNRRLNELVGFLLLVSALLLFLALATYSPLDPSFNTAAAPIPVRPAANWIGVVGALVSDMLFQLLGLAAFFLPVFVGLLGARWFRSRKIDAAVVRLSGGTALVIFFSALLALLPWHWRWLHVIPIEGLLGRIAGDVLIHYFNLVGAYLVAASCIAIALYLSTAFSFGAVRLWAETRFTFLYAVRDRYQDWQAARAKKKAAKELEKRRANRPVVTTQLIQAKNRPAAQAEAQAPVKSGIERMEEEASRNAGGPAGRMPAVPAAPQPVAMRPEPSLPQPDQDDVEITSRADAEKKSKTTMPKIAGGYKLPSSALLHRPDEQAAVNEEELKTLAKVLVEKCAEFDVHGQVTQINPGPVVTTFEMKPEAGVKYSRFTSLSEDLCLGLRAESILIERMAGKSTVGIQVPNRERETIWLRECIESQEFIGGKSKLTIGLGKDINGRLAVADLATMPHLLIAGSTGSGKSVAINAFIMSLLYKSNPDQVRLILVDPKRLELGVYEGVPHLFTPIITEPKLAANALRNAVREMERRLKLLAEKGVRNIEQYNRLFDETPNLFEKNDPEKEGPIPYIVIIIDELADLMMLDGKNVEESVTRLAQMARAIGIHLVVGSPGTELEFAL